jgi:hypothetical protein
MAKLDTRIYERNPSHYAGRYIGVCGVVAIVASFWVGGLAVTVPGLVAVFCGMLVMLMTPDAYRRPSRITFDPSRVSKPPRSSQTFGEGKRD